MVHLSESIYTFKILDNHCLATFNSRGGQLTTKQKHITSEITFDSRLSFLSDHPSINWMPLPRLNMLT